MSEDKNMTEEECKQGIHENKEDNLFVTQEEEVSIKRDSVSLTEENEQDKVPNEISSDDILENCDKIEEEVEEEESNADGKNGSVAKKSLSKSRNVVEDGKSDESDADSSDEDGGLKHPNGEGSEKSSLGEKDMLEIEDGGELKEESVINKTHSEHELKKATKKKKARKDQASLGSDDEKDVEKYKEKRKKHKKRKSIQDEKSKSEVSIPDGEEGDDKSETEEQDVQEEGEEDGVTDGQPSVVSISSAELRLAEERSAIAQQFEVLMKLRSEHVSLRKKGFHLTNRLVQYFKRQKMDHVFMETKEGPDLEEKYKNKLIQFADNSQEMAEEKARINTEWESQRSINEELSVALKQGWELLGKKQREIAARLIDPRTGRTLHNKMIEEMLSRQENQLKLVSEGRLVQIKLRRRIDAQKRERQMDHMGVDFRLMDYEKLASLKEYYTDKITERDIEIGEVRQKVNCLEDAVGQVRADLTQRQQELEQTQQRLYLLSAQLGLKRASLNKVKASRHKTEKDTAKIKHQSGLLAYPILLKDFEEKTRQLNELSSQVESLKQTYRNGVTRIRKLREAIRKKSMSKYSLSSSSIAIS